MKKRWLSLLITAAILGTFGICALASGESDTADQGKDTASVDKGSDHNLSDCNVEIKDCRLAKDYEGNPVVIVTYGYTNYSDRPTSFMAAVDDGVFQDGVGLNETIFLEDAANYSSDNQLKEIKKGASLDVEVAYDLNDTQTDVVVEVREYFSLKETVVTKTFQIAS